MPLKTNQDKGKEDPVLKEIENDESPIDNSGNPASQNPPMNLDELLNKNPNEITAEEMDFISQNKEGLTDEQKVKVGLSDVEEGEEPSLETETPDPVSPEKQPVKSETDDDREKRYRAQQAEVQIQTEKSKHLVTTITQADELPEPTDNELRDWLKKDNVELEDLSPFEKSMAKQNLLNKKKLSLITDAAQSSQKIDEWANTVDTFIDSTYGKAEYLGLNGHEADFRKYSMQASHRGVEMEVLLPAFLHSLPPAETKRGDLFNRGGGGERSRAQTDVITDATQAQQLRISNPKEYKRLLNTGKIKIEV